MRGAHTAREARLCVAVGVRCAYTDGYAYGAFHVGHGRCPDGTHASSDAYGGHRGYRLTPHRCTLPRGLWVTLPRSPRSSVGHTHPMSVGYTHGYELERLPGARSNSYSMYP